MASCPICLEPIVAGRDGHCGPLGLCSLPCGHKAHFVCIANSIAHNTGTPEGNTRTLCPFCRAPMCDDIELDAVTSDLLDSLRANQTLLEDRIDDAALETLALSTHAAELTERERARTAATQRLSPGIVPNRTALAHSHLKCPYPDCTHPRSFKKNAKGTSKALQNHIHDVHFYREAKTYYILGYAGADNYLHRMMGAYTSGTHKNAPIINGAPVYHNRVHTKRCLFRLQTGHWMISDEKDMRSAQFEAPRGFISSSNRDFDRHDPLADTDGPPNIFTPNNLTWNYSMPEGWVQSNIKVILFEKGDPLPVLPVLPVHPAIDIPTIADKEPHFSTESPTPVLEDLARELFPNIIEESSLPSAMRHTVIDISDTTGIDLQTRIDTPTEPSSVFVV